MMMKCSGCYANSIYTLTSYNILIILNIPLQTCPKLGSLKQHRRKQLYICLYTAVFLQSVSVYKHTYKYMLIHIHTYIQI